MRLRNTRLLMLLGLLVICGVSVFLFLDGESRDFSRKTGITVWDDLTEFQYAGGTYATVGDFLRGEGIVLAPGDSVFPSEESALASGSRIAITRSRSYTLRVDGETLSLETQARTVAEALAAAHVTLDEDDIVEPARETSLAENSRVAVTRVVVSEESVDKPIPYAKKTNEDDALSWRKTVVTQKGENGIERSTYRVSRHDGKEVNRKLLARERVKEPVTEVVTQGTYVKVGKSHRGGASWYAHTGTLAAANPWLPMGSYVKVTNTENGKSVIVVINDRGPFVAGRIIDLDKVAFEKIASLGSGVVHVKMEEITN